MRLLLAALVPLCWLATAQAADPVPASAPTTTTATATTTAPTAEAADAGDSQDAVDVGPWIYMVTRIKLTGTDFTQVVFFRHPAITTMDACEAERNAGLTTGWNYFSRYYLKTLKGISYRVDYRCVEGKQHLAYWHQGVPLDNFYLIRTTEGQLQVQPYRNFFACRDALKAISKTEDIDAFCGISSQAIRDDSKKP